MSATPPPSGASHWFLIEAGGWLIAAVLAVVLAPGTARRLGVALAAREGIEVEEPAGAGLSAPGLAIAGDEAS
jgi:hypothetical protein